MRIGYCNTRIIINKESNARSNCNYFGNLGEKTVWNCVQMFSTWVNSLDDIIALHIPKLIQTDILKIAISKKKFNSNNTLFKTVLLK